MKLKTLMLVASLGMIGEMAQAQQIDDDLIPTCLAIANSPSDEIALQKLNDNPITSRLRSGFGPRFKYSPEKIATNRDRLVGNIKLIEKQSKVLLSQTQDVESLLGVGAIPKNMKVTLVCGTKSDGYSFAKEGSKDIYLDLTNISPDFLPHLLTHEVWHIAFKSKYRKWAERDLSATDPLRRVAFQLINEGVGHYYSFRRRLYPQIQYKDWKDRTQKIFAMLDVETDKLATIKDPQNQDQVIFRSHAGVPFWKKWGAVPGAIIVYRLIEELGHDAVANLLEHGTCTYLGTYQEIAMGQHEWEKLPTPLLISACKKLPH